MTLGRRDGINVIATSCGDGASLEHVRASSPDVIVIDVQSSDLIEFARVLRRECLSAKLVAFAVNEQSDTMIRCAEAGVSGYVTCDAEVDELVTVIQSVLHEEYVCPPRIAAMLLRRLATQGDRGTIPVETELLTTRERQVFGLICEGLSNKEIAHRCGISEATVKNHVHHLLEKQKVRTRTQLAALAVWGSVGAAR